MELDIPALFHLPARDEVVVISSDWAKHSKEELLIGEAGQEVGILEDRSAMGGSSTGEHEDTSVQGIGGRKLEVVSLEVDAAPEVEDVVQTVTPTGAANDLVGAQPADLWILKRRANGLQEVEAGPVHVVVDEDGNGSLDSRKGMANLETLVSNGGRGDRNGSRRPALMERLDDLFDQLDVGFAHRHNEDRTGLVFQNCTDTFQETGVVGVDGRDDDSAVPWAQSWIDRNRCRLVDAIESDGVDNQAEVSEDEEPHEHKIGSRAGEHDE